MVEETPYEMHPIVLMSSFFPLSNLETREELQPLSFSPLDQLRQISLRSSTGKENPFSATFQDVQGNSCLV